MNKLELINRLKDIPDTAIIYVESDHGQTPEETGVNLKVTTDVDLDYYAEDVYWIDLTDYIYNMEDIVAILIS